MLEIITYRYVAVPGENVTHYAEAFTATVCGDHDPLEYFPAVRHDTDRGELCERCLIAAATVPNVRWQVLPMQ